ncbi:MAG TPA: xanthine dehydrogenase family protein molybdopterin-binding subunit [Gaiellaceae bacterium]|nr:xanthine dehydrogenase family protein molybdopterin-binding subunit [Gaiellaceae bacterium]
MSAASRYVGQSVPRIEDPRLLTGRGRFVADLSPPGVVHAAFLRSPYPHARIAGIDVVAARELAGVVAVLAAADLETVTRPLRIPGHDATFGALAADRVRHVGDPVALVVAESRYVAEDALALVEVDYEPLDAVATAEQALDPAGAPLFDGMAGNRSFHSLTTRGDVEEAFATADRVVRASFVQQRYANVPLEARAGIAAYDPAGRELTYTASTQNPHGLRLSLAGALGLAAQDVRVVSGDVGGGFGHKMVLYREDVAVCAASILLGVPVKWIEDRAENLASSGQARQERIELEAAVRRDGTILGLRGGIVLDQGAYPGLPIPASAYTAHVRALLPDGYRIPAYAFEESAVMTNKASYVPYRGPWASAPWSREVLVDRVARELGLDPAEVRLRNLVPLTEQPTPSVTGATLEGATPRETLERLLEIVDVPAFREEQRAARAEQVLLGLGLATLIEPAPGPADFAEVTGFGVPPERAHARIEPDGRLTIFTGQHPHGQGLETTLAQLGADELGVPLEHVRVVHGDTRDSPFSVLGTSGSRAATRGSAATVYAVRDVRDKALEIASSLLEIAAADLEIVEGTVRAKGVPGRELPLADVAAAAYFGAPELPEGYGAGALDGGGTFTAQAGGWSSATHCCIAEVDPDTGLVRLRRYVVVHDCGAIIHPAIVEGQIRGGVAQGIGGALLEESAYDEDGYFLAGTLMDYLLPTATDVPPIEIEHLESVPVAEIAYRGVGEGGAIGAPPAVTNAVADAIGVELTELPLTPTRILQALGKIA